MKLLTTNQQINSKIAKLSEDMSAHLAAAAEKSNKMAQLLANQEAAVLEGWLNEFGQQAFALFESHKVTGEKLNSISADMKATLEPQGVKIKDANVDVRPFQEKLAERGKTLEIDQATGKVTVSEINEEEI